MAVARISLEIQGHVNLETASESLCFKGNYISEILGLSVGVELEKSNMSRVLSLCAGAVKQEELDWMENLEKERSSMRGALGHKTLRDLETIIPSPEIETQDVALPTMVFSCMLPLMCNYFNFTTWVLGIVFGGQ